MAFKAYNRTTTFLNMEIQRAVSHPRNKQSLSKIDATICWEPIEKIVMGNYPVGQSESVNKAYPPLMLLKAVLLQKWYGIKYDPELETQINDRFSFKSFIDLPFSEPSPDHSIICRFRERTGKKVWNRSITNCCVSLIPWVSPLHRVWLLMPESLNLPAVLSAIRNSENFGRKEKPEIR